MNVLRCERKRMHNIECILVGSASQCERMKSASDYRVVKLHFVLTSAHSELSALENWHKAREEDGISVEKVSPSCTNLSQVASFVGWKVEEKFLEKSLIEEKLVDSVNLRRQRHEPFYRYIWVFMVMNFPQSLRCGLVRVGSNWNLRGYCTTTTDDFLTKYVVGIFAILISIGLFWAVNWHIRGQICAVVVVVIMHIIARWTTAENIRYSLHDARLSDYWITVVDRGRCWIVSAAIVAAIIVFSESVYTFGEFSWSSFDDCILSWWHFH